MDAFTRMRDTDPPKSLPYPMGLFPLIRDKIKGHRNICWYGFEDGLWHALFADWGDERALNR